MRHGERPGLSQRPVANVANNFLEMYLKLFHQDELFAPVRAACHITVKEFAETQNGKELALFAPLNIFIREKTIQNIASIANRNTAIA